jgi:hypothetical protein
MKHWDAATKLEQLQADHGYRGTGALTVQQTLRAMMDWNQTEQQ